MAMNPPDPGPGPSADMNVQPSATPPQGGGLAGFFGRRIVGFPVWAWLLILGGGAVVAFWVIPKFTSSASTASTDTTNTQGQSAGMAISPPLAGGTVATAVPDQSTLMQALAAAQGAAGGGATAAGTAANTDGTSTSTGTAQQTATAGNGTIPQYVTVAPWTAQNAPWNSTLGGIARHYGTSVDRLMSLNPQVSNPDVIITGQQIRVQ